MTASALDRIREKIRRADEALVRAVAVLPADLSDPAWRSAARGCREARFRVGLGRQVADVKERVVPERLVPLLEAGDRDALLQAITDPEVEERVLDRVGQLALLLGGERLRDRVLRFYRAWVIPETKRRQIERLLERRSAGSGRGSQSGKESTSHARSGSQGSRAHLPNSTRGV